MESIGWSWRNLSAGVESKETEDAFFYSGAPVEAYQDCFYASAGVVLVFGLTAAICMAFDVAQYRSLKDANKLILITHIAYCLIFLGTAAPYSIAMVRVLFAPGAPSGLLQPYIQRCIFYPLALQLAMYVFEGAFRSVLRINWFLFVHHLMFCTFLVLAFQSQSLFVIKVDLIVSCFATYEFMLYAALIARRVGALRSACSVLLVTGLSFYLLTRLVQLAILIGLFVLSYEPMRASGRTIALYWVSLCMCVVLVALQSYTFVIYRGIWNSTAGYRKQRQQPILPTQDSARSGDTHFSVFHQEPLGLQ